jgi:hypothetical protein
VNFAETQLQARKIAEQTGLSMADIASLPLDEFARLTRGQTPAQAAIAAFEAQHKQEHPESESAPQPPESAPQPVDIASMDMATYAQFRQEVGIGGREYGNGLFGIHGSWADAARAKAGRSAMAGNRNTVESPRIGRAFINHDDRIDHRSAAERFSTPGNEFRV